MAGFVVQPMEELCNKEQMNARGILIMAGDWMKIELELPDKPEVHAIANALQIDPDAVVGKLIRVWQWFDKHTTDGNAVGVSYSLADRIAGVVKFGDAMAASGWLEQHGETLAMPRFDRHTSASAKTRALTAKRVANHTAKTNADANADNVSDGVSFALPREEKRREEKKELKSRDATATRLPADWQPDEVSLAFCKSERPDLHAESVAARFRDYWTGIPGAKGRKLDWPATWRNWVRNESAPRGGSVQNISDKPKPKPGDKAMINGQLLTYYAGLGFAL